MMRYAELVDTYTSLESTSGTLEQTELLVELLLELEPDQFEPVVRLLRGRVFAPWEDADIGVSSRGLTTALAQASGGSAAQIEALWRDTGDLGLTAEAVMADATQRTLMSRPVTVGRVYDGLRDLATIDGAGSRRRRLQTVAGLLSDATPLEARYLARTVVGHLRLGVGDGLLRDAIVAAFGSDAPAAAAHVERAFHLTSDLAHVASVAATEGIAGCAAIELEPFRPVRAMLATKAAGISDGMTAVAPSYDAVRLERKYDGIRIQLHHVDGESRLFTRRLAEITRQFPEVLAAAQGALSAEGAIVDGELVGVDPASGRPVPFQQLSRRIKRKHDIRAIAAEVPVRLFLFDLLWCDGVSLLDRPLASRIARLEAVCTPTPGAIELATAIDGPSPEAAQAFYDAAVAAGHEGVMLKNREASYQPGTRVGVMMKHKPLMEPLDLIITRAQWSEGRRSAYLGRLFLGCYDPDRDAVCEVGRLSTGYTDAELEMLTDRLLERKQAVEGRQVRLDQDLLIEVGFEEIQRSDTYGSGYALRFPRYRRMRPDLGPSDAATLAEVAAAYDAQGAS
jgi:DNA ligase-1